LRSAACEPLALWNDHASLLALLGDPSYAVMKSAAYALGLATPDAAAGAVLRAHLAAPKVASTHATETVRAWVHHAGQTAVPDLARFATDERESVRLVAIDALVNFAARDELESVLPLLEAPPHVTWAVHIALLDACRKLRLPPRGLDSLRQVDNYWLERAIATPQQ
jgi:HEAT repeat protein